MFTLRALANSVDSNQTPQNAASGQGPYCLPAVFNTSVASKIVWVLGKVWQGIKLPVYFH